MLLTKRFWAVRVRELQHCFRFSIKEMCLRSAKKDDRKRFEDTATPIAEWRYVEQTSILLSCYDDKRVIYSVPQLKTVTEDWNINWCLTSWSKPLSRKVTKSVINVNTQTSLVVIRLSGTLLRGFLYRVTHFYPPEQLQNPWLFTDCTTIFSDRAGWLFCQWTTKIRIARR